MSNELIVETVKSIPPPSERACDEDDMYEEWIGLTVRQAAIFQLFRDAFLGFFDHAAPPAVLQTDAYGCSSALRTVVLEQDRNLRSADVETLTF
jgi:hypothetical protein